MKSYKLVYILTTYFNQIGLLFIFVGATYIAYMNEDVASGDLYKILFGGIFFSVLAGWAPRKLFLLYTDKDFLNTIGQRYDNSKVELSKIAVFFILPVPVFVTPFLITFLLYPKFEEYYLQYY